MITTRHRTMLRAICGRPRTAREFTNAQHDALSPNACVANLNSMVKAGLIEVNANGLYEATEAGHAALQIPTTAPRTYCAASVPSSEPYRGPSWNIRAGGEVARCDAVVLLPGWERSRGARVEFALATGLGLEVMTELEARFGVGSGEMEVKHG